MQTRLSRAEVPVETTWNLQDLFADEPAWPAEYEALDGARQAVINFQRHLADGAANLLACLTAEESLYARLMRVRAYANLLYSQDGTDPQYQAACARVSALSARVGASTSFIASEILALPAGRL